MTNPFPHDPDRAAIWEMLVPRDIAAFVKGDWSMVEGDFIEQGFIGLDAQKASNPDQWRVNFPTLQAYRDEWLRQATETAKIAFAEDLYTGIFRATTLSDIDIKGDIAVAHKKFNGTNKKADGSDDVLFWQTLYFVRKVDGRWKLTGFVGYMPYDFGA